MEFSVFLSANRSLYQPSSGAGQNMVGVDLWHKSAFKNLIFEILVDVTYFTSLIYKPSLQTLPFSPAEYLFFSWDLLICSCNFCILSSCSFLAIAIMLMMQSTTLLLVLTILCLHSFRSFLYLASILLPARGVLFVLYSPRCQFLCWIWLFFDNLGYIFSNLSFDFLLHSCQLLVHFPGDSFHLLLQSSDGFLHCGQLLPHFFFQSSDTFVCFQLQILSGFSGSHLQILGGFIYIFLQTLLHLLHHLLQCYHAKPLLFCHFFTMINLSAGVPPLM